MLCVILDRAGLEPAYVIGGGLIESGSGARAGNGEWFVAETDESDGSFLLLAPEVGVVTNVEEDHLDFYSGADEIRAAFAAFVERCGHVVACGDDAGTRAALADAGGPARTYGLGSGSDVRLRGLGESLAHADVVVVTDVYGADEHPIPGITGKLVVDGLTEAVPSKRVVYLPRRAEIVRFLLGEIRPGDLVVTLGAGDVTTLAE